MLVDATIKKLVRNELHRRGYLVHRASELTRLANKFGSDKGTRLSAHMYTRVYENFFEPLRHKRLCVLEMGLLRSDIDRRRSFCASEGKSTARASDAPSLKTWRAFFPNAKIFGFDIDDFSEVSIPGCRIMKGDMSSRADIERLMTSIGEPIDIFASPYISDAEKEYLCQNTFRVWLFDSLSHEVRDNSDAIAVIEKLG
jgi:hypothetical protein